MSSHFSVHGILSNNSAFTILLDGEDYIGINKDISLQLGDERRCVGIVIIDNVQLESDETFQLSISGLEVVTSLTILDDDGML